MSETVLDVWNEVRITSEGISISLYSETQENGAVVEDEAWFTWSEMQSMSPTEPLSLNLSKETRQSLIQSESAPTLAEKAEDLPDNPSSDELLEYMGLTEQSGMGSLEEGDIAWDMDPPSWAESDTLKVVEVLENVAAYEYVVEGPNAECVLAPENQLFSDETVADKNPGHDEEQVVIRAKYVKAPESIGKEYSDTYAFPASRLDWLGK